MAEDVGLCTYVKHHKQKIVLFLSAMRSYSDSLKEDGYKHIYKKLDTKNPGYFNSFKATFPKVSEIVCFEVEDKFFEKEIVGFCKANSIKLTWLKSPMFLSTRKNFSDYLSTRKKPFMKTFYEQQRKENNILLEADGSPIGGKWSYDVENRKKLPKNVEINKKLEFKKTQHTNDVCKLVEKVFKDHPGRAEDIYFPTERSDYLKALNHFLKNNLDSYGKYQDAITNRDPFLFHSLISPGLNLGLITPKEVIHKTLQHYDKNPETPLSAIEGFIRQIIGWREFLRGVYQNYSEEQDTTNFWNHKREMKASWYSGETGIPPVDDAIKKAIKYGYNHHIERLMVLSSIMLLSEINPRQVHDWFMEMYVDSSDWVMGPNVYGMGQFSDGGIFATKPYICGSNYLIKMSDYKKAEWCDTVDGLYWRFIDKHQKFFSKNPRMKMMMSALDRMDKDKKKRIFKAANNFIKEHTC